MAGPHTLLCSFVHCVSSACVLQSVCFANCVLVSHKFRACFLLTVQLLLSIKYVKFNSEYPLELSEEETMKEIRASTPQYDNKCESNFHKKC